ncbi:toll/interleukin-1 receptor domain-containing protein [Candidatus Sulfurimonas baltica]|uniref:Toll/interleukin-1 receptor domain-containing protein n=1 Tax=Candidatus Sulfurimonas baltica TaxID=2740404 RepID=A0A7S7LXH5_9BACT|nr:toll/interleukin-1 receptor domain-containing protein [Candidatus Sulfurimonas baltica]QOY53237.1 toll/interleukin-1 receptor domain-containing protein [Candidatus Sulfurimonas baltica]
MSESIFISYNSYDSELATAISDALQKNNITNWFAPNMIGIGEHYARTITPAITGCEIFLLLASKYSVGSKKENMQGSGEVLNELQLASNNRRIILPFKLDDALENGAEDGFAYLLAKSQWLDVSKDAIQKQVEFIVENIKDVLKNGLKNCKNYSSNLSEQEQAQNIKKIEKALKSADLATAENIFTENVFAKVYDDEILLLRIITSMIKNNIRNLSSKSVDRLLLQLDALMHTQYKHHSIYLKTILSVLYFKVNGVFDTTGGFDKLHSLATELPKVPAKYILMFRNIKDTNIIELKWKHFL